MSLRYVDTGHDRARWRSTGSYRVLPALQLGLEWNPVAGELAPLATAFLLTETETRPAVFFGTSSDRIGSPEGTQAYYMTVARYFPSLRASPYLSVNYSEWDSGWNIPFGANVDVGGGFSLQPMYDGQRSHLLAAWTRERLSFTLIWAWLESAGAAVAVGF